MGHDQLFKGILRRFFREFIELFFPDLAARLDLESAEFPEAELFKGFPDGGRREPDVVGLVRTREGDPGLVLVHVEVQARTERDFDRRMYEYYSLLWLRFDMPVFPIVLYIQKGKSQGTGTRTYMHELFGHEVITFRYSSIALAPIRGEEYVDKSPLATALSGLMRWGRNTDVLELRLRLLRRLMASDLDEASLFSLVNMIETYVPVPRERLEQYRRMLSRKENRDVENLELTWADRLREEGREEGRVEGKRDNLERLLVVKFGPLPAEVEARLRALTSVEELDRYLERVLTASSLDEIGLGELPG